MLFSVKKERSYLSHYIPLLLLVLLIAVFCIASDRVSTDNSQRSYSVVENALNRSITQCYALEGTYPPSLDYLTEHYGFVYNEDRYIIYYEYIGANIRPSVDILERK